MKTSEQYIDKLNKILNLCLNDDEPNQKITQAISNLIKYLKKYEEIINEEIQETTYHSSPYIELAKHISQNVRHELSKYQIENRLSDSTELTIISVIVYQNGHDKLLKLNKSDELLFENLNNDFKRLDLLEIIRDTDKNIILLGANGSGKSSLANFLKNSGNQKIIVAPAQKYLFIPEGGGYYDKTTADYDFIRNQQLERDFKRAPNMSEFEYYFKNLITALINEHTEEANKYYLGSEYTEFNKSKMGILCRIFNELLPNIQLKIITKNRSLNVISLLTNESYDFNLMSDGERAVIFYLANVLIAELNSIIVIDEPETYINPSIYKELWDRLISERSDCQFIFITHSMDFIASRAVENTKFYWLKQFNAPQSWEIEVLPTIGEMPKTLVAELASSRKPILFCEGTFESWDYQIYSILFSDKYTIQPVESHTSVINYTKAFNDSHHLHHNNAIGIIDGDLLFGNRIEQYKNNHIHVLPFNEIEMILLWQPIIKEVLKPFNDESNIKQKITAFQNKLFASVLKKKQRIITAAVKKEIDGELENYRIQDDKSIENIKAEMLGLSEKLADIDAIAEKISGSLESALEAKDYDTLLILCNLKGEILNGLGNTNLDHDYAKKAKHALANDLKLQNQIKAKFFKDIH